MSWENNSEVQRVEIVKAMLEAHGDYAVAKALLGERMSVEQLRVYVAQDEKLRLLYLPPTKSEILSSNTQEEPLVAGNTISTTVERQTSNDISKINLQLTLESMKKAGIKQSILDKIETLNSVQLSGAAFLATTLNSTQKILHFEVLKLMEQMEFIDRQINSPAIPDKAKIAWMYLYANLSEQICKYHDRILASTEALVRMSNRDRKTKADKPGFTER